MSKAVSYLKLLLLLLCISKTIFTQAQQLDMAVVLQEATEKYPSIKAQQAAVESSGREKRAVSNAYLPRLSMQHQYTFSTSNNVEGAFYPNGITISPSGGIRTENVDEGAFGSFTSALLEWDVYSFGKLSANTSAARAEVAVSKNALDNEIFQHQIHTADAYLQLLIAEKLTQIQQRNLERATSFSEAVDANVRSGLRPGVDSSLAHAEYVKARMLLLESERHENARRYQLMELLGRDAQMESVTIDSMYFFHELPDVAETDEPSLNENPLLQLQLAKIAASQQRGIAMKRSFYPAITLVGAAWARGSGISNTDQEYHTDFSHGVDYQVHNYLIGAAIRWTPTDLAASRNRFKKYEHLVQQQTEQYNEQQLRLKRQLRESEMQYEVMLEQANTAPVQLAASQQAYLQANARYKNGLTDLPTMLQSVVALNRAEADVAIAYSNVWRSLLMLAAAKGDLSDFIRPFN
uniref:TolC family protein n=1 Tax=Roseihalotalea indica TaxID=2867963 RepID=A0AA49GS36_9BACT|nr:TolC family protein [Tunicatimonas sp. TK19036]